MGKHLVFYDEHLFPKGQTKTSKWWNLTDTSYEIIIDLTSNLDISDAGMQLKVKCLSKRINKRTALLLDYTDVNEFSIIL